MPGITGTCHGTIKSNMYGHNSLGLKIKDAAKACGKKFSSGASVNEGATGAKEVVIQGDVSFDLPPLLTSKFNVSQ